MVFPSAYYFLFYGAFSVLLPFLAIFYKAQGLPARRSACWQPFHRSSLFLVRRSGPAQPMPATVTSLSRMVSILGVVVIAFIIPGIASFGGLLLMISLYAFFGAPTASLVDSAVLTMLGDRKERYGRIRLWGTIGYGRCRTVAAVVSVKRLPPYRTLRSTSMRDMVSQLRKLPLHLPDAQNLSAVVAAGSNSPVPDE